jgi:hypothetical protein
MPKGVNEIDEGAVVSDPSPRREAATAKTIPSLDRSQLRIRGEEHLKAVIDLVPPGLMSRHPTADSTGALKNQHREPRIR